MVKPHPVNSQQPASKNDFIEIIWQYIEQGDTEKAVALLRLQIAEYNPDLLNSAISLSGRYRRAKGERAKNIISRDDYERTIAQIDHAVLEILPKIVNNTSNNLTSKTSMSTEAEESGHIKEPEMVFVQGGAFKMGSNNFVFAKPIHTVTVNSFYISKYPITVAQFAEFIHDSAYVTTAEKEDFSLVYDGSEWNEKEGVIWKHGVGGFLRLASEYNHPVVHVSWHDSIAYCEWLSRKTGKKYRLPTEAEWEYAARGGKKTREYQYNGSDNVHKVAWYAENSGDNTHEVGTLDPNELGIYDMSGNVWEWCEDVWHETYEDSPNDGSAWLTGEEQCYRVYRGGSWSDDKANCQITNRISTESDLRYDGSGFRIVRGN